MKTSAEVYEVILATARRQAETSASGKALRTTNVAGSRRPNDVTSDDLDMLLAMICGNIASYVTLRSDLEEIQDKVRLLADECTKMARDLKGRVTAIGDINAMWVANQLREIVGPE
jgi:hypothetical protein